ncbi:hypothetical protein C2845_PM06G15950 [Panicum miliaceum]|uniref:At1g61320/AtMIF1 LRR domain-containing protein n=1 Tax=Panicum miliaceum TaxID=4540 RepID=A0A3L6R7L6_PANMI|nr:hypothetical protein C2845_PM06G15950 [Panicum miliaceum]
MVCMQDILHLIHSLMPMRDAARAACVSRSFLHPWICHPNLNFSKYTLGLNENACQKDESARFFYIKVDHILKKHSGIGVKKLKIQINSDYSANKGLVFSTGDELGFPLSHSLALEQLELRNCDRIVFLKVPRLLQRLNYLEVRGCAKLKVIHNEAPNVSSFVFGGDSTVQLSVGETLQMKSLTMDRYGSVSYARAELPSSMPNLEALTIYTFKRAYAPMLCSKLLFLRHLSIALIGAPVYPTYDYLSLASFFYAAPSLETFNLNVSCHSY